MVGVEIEEEKEEGTVGLGGDGAVRWGGVCGGLKVKSMCIYIIATY